MLVKLTDFFDQIQFDIKYATDDNFIGRPFLGYEKNLCLLHFDLVAPLQKVLACLKSTPYQLLIWDSYRPMQAIQDIYQWSLDRNDQIQKERFYPNVEKSELFDLGYLAMTSSHSRGIALDLTLVEKSGLQVDCGSSFDYFDPVSHFSSSIIKPEQYNNRLMLRELMQQAGFIPYEKEWWHFRLDCDLSNYPGQDILIK
jgi:D-alanyl-D-alanine dipeptidase